MKITYAVAASMDGYIARENGDVRWLEELKIDPDETGLREFFAGVDGLVMGRATYDFVFEYGSWPYEDKPTWVLTHREIQALEGANLLVVDNVDDVMEQAAAKKLSHLWLIGGSQVASAFLERGLMTNLSISEMPVELFSGIPMFSDHSLEHIEISEKTVFEKTGFRQIEISLKTDHDIKR